MSFVACERKAELDLSVAPEGAIEQGVALMGTHCHTCHGVGESRMDAMLAPPLWGVRAHYLARHSDPEDFVDAMTAFVQKPRMESSLLLFEVARYGLKAPVSLSEAEIRSVSWAIYAGRVERPSWSREYRKRHASCEANW
ncbi:hypothetical protein DDZ13_14135 [Coraliomargarita sinensis]|uniref:Cytochrome c domain-containing protein n=2 Tax=Coraliomargarita sinensis TaxID=2174842 RepID=A0A317ZEB5_9BACT|nr:hypothetical protein DDZ13_14135 [Coraliomargarita sinensis]